MHLVLGHGGAGVTTVAAAGVADVGRRVPRSLAPAVGDPSGTLMITLDRFHDAARLFGVFSRPGEPIPVARNAYLHEIDRLDLSESLWLAVTAALPEAVGDFAAAFGDVDAGELLGLPGIDQFLALRAIRDAATSGRWTSVVIDCSGGVDPYELFRVPESVGSLIERLWPRHRRLAVMAVDPRLAKVAALVDALLRDCADLAELFSDPAGISAHVVTSAGERGIDAAARHVSVLDLLGIPVASVVVNGVSADDRLDAGWRGRIGDIAGAAAVIEAPALSAAPASVADLRALRVRLASSVRPVRGPARAQVDRLGGTGLAARFRLHWPQLLPEPSDLRLGRSGDNLFVTICGVRRAVRLPSVLRRCVVDGARWECDTLSIDFRPDPGLWPVRGSVDGSDSVSEGVAREDQGRDDHGHAGAARSGG